MKFILSIDGGGIRGLIAAMICKRIEEEAEKPLHETFDLIAGTSTGGIIALGLTRPPSPLSMTEIIDFYKIKGPRIFADPSRLKAIVRGPRHNNQSLKAALESTFGAVVVADALTNVLIPSYDLGLRQLTLVTRRSARAEPEENYKMSDVALGTSAAPTYFSPAQVAGKTLVDGGVVANNPATLAIAEARRLWPNEELLLVSVGTGRLVDAIAYEKAATYGLIQWAAPAIDCIFDGTAKATEHYLKTTMDENNDYWRFQLPLRELTSAMDNASSRALTAMEVDTTAYIESEEVRIRRLASILKAPKAEPVKLTPKETENIIKSVCALSENGDEKPYTRALAILDSEAKARRTYNLTSEQLDLIVDRICKFQVPGDRAAHLRGIKILEAALDAQEDNYGINERLIAKLMRNYLDRSEAAAMHAVDVLGPAGWTSPTTYRYLALQVRHYVMKNMSAETWDIHMSEMLAGSITRCIEAAKKNGLNESDTKFDNPDILKWRIASPKLEYSRTLLWTSNELLSAAGRTVIDVHNAFHVPLFFLETAEDDEARDIDFIYLARASDIIGGFYGHRKQNYKTEDFAEGGYIPGHDRMADQYKKLLASDRLMFAADAYLKLKALKESSRVAAPPL
jgi:predicted acylesterase/phospholipase RssA